MTATATDLSKTEALIAQMIAKAESTTFPAEAEMFMARAEKLMMQHGIQRANLEAKATNAQREQIVTEHVTIANGNGYASASANIYHGLASAFSVRTFKSSGLRNGVQVVWMVGFKSDVEQLQQLASSLVEQARKQAVAWWKANKGDLFPFGHTHQDGYLARREFINSFGRGARQRLDEIRNQVVAEAETGTALVLVERVEKVDAWVAGNMQVGRARATRQQSGGAAARRAGTAAGREAVSPKQVR